MNLPGITVRNFIAWGTELLGELLDDRHICVTHDGGRFSALPDLAGRHEVIDGELEARPHRHDHACRSGTQERGEQWIDVVILKALDPRRAPPPEVWIEHVCSVLPFERLFEEANVWSLESCFGDVGLRKSERPGFDRVEEVKVLRSQELDAGLLELASFDPAINGGILATDFDAGARAQRLQLLFIARSHHLICLKQCGMCSEPPLLHRA